MKVSKERMEIIKIGIELRVLRKKDIEFIADLNNSEVMVQNRLRQRIMDMPADWHEDGCDMIWESELEEMLSA